MSNIDLLDRVFIMSGSKPENAVTLHPPGTHPWIFFINNGSRYKWIVAVERHLYTFDNEQDAREYFVLRNLEY